MRISVVLGFVFVLLLAVCVINRRIDKLQITSEKILDVVCRDAQWQAPINFAKADSVDSCNVSFVGETVEITSNNDVDITTVGDVGNVGTIDPNHIFIKADSVDFMPNYVDSNNVAAAINSNPLILKFSPSPEHIIICEIVRFTPADSNGIARVKWLDPNHTEIDAGAKWFFETYLKNMCDEYIRNNCPKAEIPCEFGECPFCKGTGCGRKLENLLTPQSLKDVNDINAPHSRSLLLFGSEPN